MSEEVEVQQEISPKAIDVLETIASLDPDERATIFAVLVDEYCFHVDVEGDEDPIPCGELFDACEEHRDENFGPETDPELPEAS